MLTQNKPGMARKMYAEPICETIPDCMKLALITPARPSSTSGNRTTAERWARLLRRLGHEVELAESWDGEPADAMIALHARRSHPSIKRFASEFPERSLMVVLTGTDLYRDIHEDADAQRSLTLATLLVVLQEAGTEELPPEHREKARVIYQSAQPASSRPAPVYPEDGCFEVCVLGNLRPEKDPLRPALAAGLLPPGSRVRVTHAGAVHDEDLARRARDLAAGSPRYRWIGELSAAEARRRLASSRLLVQSSLLEGGANAVSEAVVCGVPVLASEIPGNVGMLGRDYPGYYPAADETALARLLRRTETDAAFYGLLRERCARRRPLFLPERELRALQGLLAEAGVAARDGKTTPRGPGSQKRRFKIYSEYRKAY
jgi:putative glycosyltransferase (TIGR04348 family)